MPRVPRVFWVEVLRGQRPVRAYWFETDLSAAEVRRQHPGFRVKVEERSLSVPAPSFARSPGSRELGCSKNRKD